MEIHRVSEEHIEAYAVWSYEKILDTIDYINGKFGVGERRANAVCRIANSWLRYLETDDTFEKFKGLEYVVRTKPKRSPKIYLIDTKPPRGVS